MRNYFLIFFWFITSFFAFAQSDSTIVVQNEASNLQMLKQDGALILKSLKHIYTRPLHWEKENWLNFGGIVAGTSLVYLADNDINAYFVKQNEKVPNYIKDFGFRFGKPLANYGLTGSIYAFGLITKNEKVRHTGILLLSSATASGIIQTIAKTSVGRARPMQGEGKNMFKPFENTAGYHSFPSGHAILSITTAHAIAKQIDNPWIKSGIYALGSITPISRLWANAHWATDVVLGSTIAIVVVNSMDKFLKNEFEKEKINSKNAFHWQFKFGLNQIGIVGTLN